jgi:hypothetical protein
MGQSEYGSDYDQSYQYNTSWIHNREGHSDSITTSVTIRVTPEHYFLVSWSILWAGFVFAIGLATFQVVREYKWIRERKQEQEGGLSSGGVGAGDVEAISSADVTRTIVSLFLIPYSDLMLL